MKRGYLLLLSLLLCLPALGRADGGSVSSTPAASPADVKKEYESGYRSMKAEDYKAAIRSFQKVIDAEPKHAMAYTNMAYSYRQLGNYKKAVNLYNTALKIQPNLAEAHEYMGAALVALGKLAEAKEHLVVLEQLNPQLADQLRAEITKRERS